jgi:hypothetical protein
MDCRTLLKLDVARISGGMVLFEYVLVKGKFFCRTARSTSLMTTDPRFSIIHTDPRFARPKKKDVKVPIDSRFRAAFKDKEFIDQRNTPLSSNTD